MKEEEQKKKILDYFLQRKKELEQEISLKELALRNAKEQIKKVIE